MFFSFLTLRQDSLFLFTLGTYLKFLREHTKKDIVDQNMYSKLGKMACCPRCRPAKKIK
jgi:hypothetical protein